MHNWSINNNAMMGNHGRCNLWEYPSQGKPSIKYAQENARLRTYECQKTCLSLVSFPLFSFGLKNVAYFFI